ncbi:TauD-domain-containing protein [Ascobolus immersus RN42]|uniref:TauD-domain-containing protein n=1 Tax=Ascobolus immersus RN42 TaxID=1160509 RepID=A0A3N4I603_ASCIM|nr:TauD-domain-containing protein [Ascobolus immersus RN42]
MAPGVVLPDPITEAPSTNGFSKPIKTSPPQPQAASGNKFGYVPGVTKKIEDEGPYEYYHFTPSFPDLSWAPLEHVPYTDKGTLGDPSYANLLADATDVFDYSPKIGTEIRGVKLENLNDAQKNDLARLIAHRGVVFFRDQDTFNVEDQLALGAYFGKLHAHATTAVPKGAAQDPKLNDIHVVWANENSKSQQHLAPLGYFWHSDVTYEKQPPSYTSLKLLSGPPRGGGGDTLWSSLYAAYDALSRPMQIYLESLTALHSADEQAQGSIQAGHPVRRQPITTEHPLVRTHPVTGWKSLFYNPGFVRAIKGVPKHESDVILKYLNDVVVTIPENQVRFTWEKNSVAFWDNRITNHSATYHFWPHRRHGIRVTPHGEVPTYDPAGRSQEEQINEELGRPALNKDAAVVIANYND